MTSKCPVCAGTFERRHVVVFHWRDGDPMLIENVPADVCRQCGERWFAQPASDAMSEFYLGSPAPDRHIQVPVYRLPDGISWGVETADEAMPGDLITTADAASIIGVNRQRVHQFLETGALKGRRVGRDWLLVRSVVEEFATRERKSGRPPKATA